MKAATSNEIKNHLKLLPSGRLVELCLRLVRFKKENKELVTYLLFEADNLPLYIETVKNHMDESFSQINTSSIYFVKKSIRKIFRHTNKFIRYTGDKQAEIELLLYFCNKLKNSSFKMEKSNSLINLYKGQVKKIELSVADLHEDLQYDYKGVLDNLKTKLI
ncbi:MAG: hypothetical protein NVS1B13_14260 [Flavisolibacter sp.]